MASRKVSALTAATTLVGTETLHAVQAGQDRKVTAAQIAALVSGGTSGAAAPAITLSRGEPGDDAFTKLVRLSDTAIFSAAQGSFASLYYPFVLRVDDLIPTPLGTYYMWYSSDHDTGGPGGVGLATAPTRLGPWTNRGVVFQDTVQGNQTETPSIVWNDEATLPIGTGLALDSPTDTVTKTAHGLPADRAVRLTLITTATGVKPGVTYYVVQPTANTFKLALTPGGTPIDITASGTATVVFYGVLFMYYQQNALGFNQSTALAKSPDGVTWTRFGLVIDYPHFVVGQTYNEMPGQGHTGYAKVHKFGTQWIAYHLFGGSLSHFAVAYSHDGEVWQTDPRLLYLNSDLAGDPAAQFTVLDFVRARGAFWGIGIQGVPGDYFVAIAPLAANLRNYLGPARKLLKSELPFEGVYVRSHTLLVDEGRLFMYYTTEDATGVGGNVGIAEIL